ncbi:MAG: bifunctional oligoribonuclease/PAP phosphatase NrnA [Mariprofundaceae bacterium]|nr:bifunctional oligoribonuclease/PAP phosphatase NrnA [Mariprofundaceae bacterium]
MTDWDKACEAIRKARGILLTTHCSPDGDGIGSQIALYHALKDAGRNVYMHNRDSVPRIYHFFPGSDAVTEGEDFAQKDIDLIISLDAGSRSRLGFPDVFFEGRRLLDIDHHASNDRFGDINLLEIKACSTGAIIFELIERLGLRLSPAIATAIYVTVLTDTSSFRNAATTADALDLAARLVRAGAEPWPIAREVYESHSKEMIELLRTCLGTLELRDGGRSAWLYVNAAMYEHTGGDAQDTEGFIEYARSLQGVDIAVFIRPEIHTGWKVTFRGKYDADVGKLAASLGGGGHHHAAGCTLHGTFEEVQGKARHAVSSLLAVCRT